MKAYQIVSTDGYTVYYGDIYISKDKAEIDILHKIAIEYDAWLDYKDTAEAAQEATGDEESYNAPYDGTFESFTRYSLFESVYEHDVIV